MARRPRIEYAGPFYHVISRGDHGEAICQDDEDRQGFYWTDPTASLKRLCNISQRQAFDDLKSLVEMGFLTRIGSGRTTSYIPTRNGELPD